MRKYERPEMKVLVLNQADVVTASGVQDVEGLVEIQDSVLFKDAF